MSVMSKQGLSHCSKDGCQAFIQGFIHSFWLTHAHLKKRPIEQNAGCNAYLKMVSPWKSLTFCESFFPTDIFAILVNDDFKVFFLPLKES